MALPANLSTVTITGTYIDLNGTPLNGSIQFEMDDPLETLSSPAVNVTVVPSPIVVSVAGSFSAVVPTTNDPDISPQFRYRVTETFPALNVTRTYRIEVPFDSPSTLDIADILPF